MTNKYGKSFLLSILIVILFIILFEILGFTLENSWIAETTIIVFTMLFCTYTITDHLKK